MLQPFEKFIPGYIDRLIGLDKFYLVSQTYTRVKNRVGEDEKIPILLSDYDDPGLAKGHYKAVINDRFAAIIDLGKPAHRAKLVGMLNPESGYAVYWSVVKSRKQLENRITEIFKDKVRHYIDKNTNWRLDGNATVRPSVQMIFGELFIVIKHGKQVIRIKFEELENT